MLILFQIKQEGKGTNYPKLVSRLCPLRRGDAGRVGVDAAVACAAPEKEGCCAYTWNLGEAAGARAVYQLASLSGSSQGLEFGGFKI